MHAQSMTDWPAIDAMILARLSDMVLGAAIAAVATWAAFANDWKQADPSR